VVEPVGTGPFGEHLVATELAGFDRVLAMSLNNLSNHLADPGRRDESERGR
jgi:hypothetical protein